MSKWQELREFAVTSSGIDWLTFTTDSDRDGLRLRDIYEDVKARTALDGDLERGWHWQGFAGSQSRKTAFGWRERDNRYVLIMKSDAARKNYWRVNGLRGKLTRLDIQITLSYDKPVDLISKMLSVGVNSLKSPKMIAGGKNVQSETLTLGTRGNERFFRLYDKGEEQGTHKRHHLWRVEFEVKNRLASRVLKKLTSIQRVDDAVFCAIIADIADEMGLFFPLSYETAHLNAVDIATETAFKNEISDSERLLAWLSASVRPAVVKLFAEGLGEQVMMELGFNDEMRHSDRAASGMRRAIEKLYNDPNLW